MITESSIAELAPGSGALGAWDVGPGAGDPMRSVDSLGRLQAETVRAAAITTRGSNFGISDLLNALRFEWATPSMRKLQQPLAPHPNVQQPMCPPPAVGGRAVSVGSIAYDGALAV